MHKLTFNALFKQVTTGKLNQKQFLTEIRKNPHLSREVSSNLTFNQTISFLKNKGLLPKESVDGRSTFNIRQFLNEATQNRVITRDEAHPYQFQIGIQAEMEKNGGDFEKAEISVLKHLTTDPYYYTSKSVGTLNQKDPNKLLQENLSELAPSTYQSAADKALDAGKTAQAGNLQVGVKSSLGLKNITVDNKAYHIVKARIESPKTAWQTLEIELSDGCFIEVQSAGISFHGPNGVRSGLLAGSGGEKLSIDRPSLKALITLHTKLFPGVGLQEETVDSFETQLSELVDTRLQELSSDTYDRASATAKHRGQTVRADKFASSASDARLGETGVRSLKLDGETVSVTKVGKSTPDGSRIELSNNKEIVANQYNMEYNGKQLASNSGDRPKVTVDRVTANKLMKLASKLSYNYSLDSFNVSGIHSEQAINELSPKTYANAAAKANGQEDYNRGQKFQNASIQASSETPKGLEKFVGKSIFKKEILSIFQNQDSKILLIDLATSPNSKVTLYYSSVEDKFKFEHSGIEKLAMDESDKFMLSQIAKIFNRNSKLSPDTVKNA